VVIPALYRPPDEAAVAPTAGAAIPGMERAGRFGTRAALGAGWRAAIARLIGRTDLAAAPARVAAAALAAPARLPVDDATLWIATPVHLSAGLARVYLDHGGLLRLRAPGAAAPPPGVQ